MILRLKTRESRSPPGLQIASILSHALQTHTEPTTTPGPKADGAFCVRPHERTGGPRNNGGQGLVAGRIMPAPSGTPKHRRSARPPTQAKPAPDNGTEKRRRPRKATTAPKRGRGPRKARRRVAPCPRNQHGPQRCHRPRSGSTADRTKPHHTGRTSHSPDDHRTLPRTPSEPPRHTTPP